MNKGNSGFTIVLLAVYTSILLVACGDSSSIIVNEENRNEMTAEVSSKPTPALEPVSSTLPIEGERNEEALKTWDAENEMPSNVQLNLSIRELYHLFNKETVETYHEGSYTIDIERIYKNYVNDDGIVFTRFYSDKPKISGSGEVANLINSIFDNEASGFFYGRDDSIIFKTGQYDIFDHYITRRLVYCGGTMSEEPATDEAVSIFDKNNEETGVQCTLRATVTYLDNSIVCVKYDYYWQVPVGHMYHSQYGMTFDLVTGKLLPISYFVGGNLENFKQLVEDTVYDSVEEAWIESALAGQEGYEFSDYEYYYDGEHIILLLDETGPYALGLPLQLPGTYSPSN